MNKNRIEFHFTKEFCRGVVEDDETSGWIEVTIKINDTYIYGDDEQGVTGLACSIVLQLLESVESIAQNERFYIEFEYGPSWMVIEPVDTNSSNIARSSLWEGIKDPSKRLDIDPCETIPNSTWIELVITSSKSFRNKILKLNPSLDNDKDMETIGKKINTAEMLLEEKF